MSEEKIIYEKRNIKITNLRAIFGDKTYAMSNITSVEKGSIAPSGGFSFFFTLFGVIIGLLAFLATPSMRGPIWLLAGLMLIGGIGTMLMGSKTEYYVQFASSAGEIKAHTSDDEAEIKQIVEAINQAIIQKG